MYTAQLALKSFLTNAKANNFSEVETIKEYAGELKDAVKLNSLVPAVLIFPDEATPIGIEPEFNLDLLVVTKSDSFDKAANASNNMQLAEKIVNYIDTVPGWDYGNTSWLIDRELVRLSVASIDNKFAIAIISLQSIKNLK